MTERNVFLYWVGRDFKLILILRDLIRQHSKNGIGYKVHLITNENVKEYLIDPLPVHFAKYCPAHQADYVRVCVVCRLGGIWLDSDTIVMGSLDSLFDLLETKNGFFIMDHNESISNGVFGSKPNTPLMNLWLETIESVWVQDEKDIAAVEWTTFGSKILDDNYEHKRKLFKQYKIFEGYDNLFPVRWEDCKKVYIDWPYCDYQCVVKKFQPLIILVRPVYMAWQKNNKHKKLNGKNKVINYFLNKSFENIDVDMRCKNKFLRALHASI
jgi:hypothetical protein